MLRPWHGECGDHPITTTVNIARFLDDAYRSALARREISRHHPEDLGQLTAATQRQLCRAGVSINLITSPHGLRLINAFSTDGYNDLAAVTYAIQFDFDHLGKLIRFDLHSPQQAKTARARCQDEAAWQF